MHGIDFHPALAEGEGMGEDHAVGWEEVLVWGCVHEVLVPDSTGEEDEYALRHISTRKSCARSGRHTRVMNKCRLLSVRKRCMKLPSGGIMCG